MSSSDIQVGFRCIPQLSASFRNSLKPLASTKTAESRKSASRAGSVPADPQVISVRPLIVVSV